jgi:hypothetical protein
MSINRPLRFPYKPDRPPHRVVLARGKAKRVARPLRPRFLLMGPLRSGGCGTRGHLHARTLFAGSVCIAVAVASLLATLVPGLPEGGLGALVLQYHFSRQAQQPHTATKSKPDRFLEVLDDLERQWLAGELRPFGKGRDATGGIDRTSHLFAKPRCLPVHMIFVLPLFRFCSAVQRNTRQHLDMSRHLGKQA